MTICRNDWCSQGWFVDAWDGPFILNGSRPDYIPWSSHLRHTNITGDLPHSFPKPAGIDTSWARISFPEKVWVWLELRHSSCQSRDSDTDCAYTSHSRSLLGTYFHSAFLLICWLPGRPPCLGFQLASAQAFLVGVYWDRTGIYVVTAYRDKGAGREG